MPAAKRTDKPRTLVQNIDVIGLKFRWKRDARHMLAGLIASRGGIRSIRIEREPDNKYDANALKVSLPAGVLDGRQLGYIRAVTAEVLAPRIDNGDLTVVSATLLNLDSADDYNSGEMVITFRRKG